MNGKMSPEVKARLSIAKKAKSAKKPRNIPPEKVQEILRELGARKPVDTSASFRSNGWRYLYALKRWVVRRDPTRPHITPKDEPISGDRKATIRWCYLRYVKDEFAEAFLGLVPHKSVILQTYKGGVRHDVVKLALPVNHVVHVLRKLGATQQDIGKYMVGLTEAWVEYSKAPEGSYGRRYDGPPAFSTIDEALAAIEEVIQGK